MSSVDKAAASMGNLTISGGNRTQGAIPNGCRFLAQEEEGIVGNTTVDSFNMVDTVGTGTFGIVRLCSLEGIDRPFSMKILSKAQLLRLNQEIHIMSERQILGRVQHPFI